MNFVEYIGKWLSVKASSRRESTDADLSISTRPCPEDRFLPFADIHRFPQGFLKVLYRFLGWYLYGILGVLLGGDL